MRLLLALVVGVAAMAETARADEQTDAVALVQQVREAAIALSFGRSPEAQKQSIGTAFDGAGIGQRVLGDYWATASDGDRTAVVDALLEGIALVLADRLMGTGDQNFVVNETRILTNGDILVRSQFVPPVRQPTAVDWRVRRCEGRLCIGDVIVDGASLTVTRRDQVLAELAGNGGSIPKLIANLTEGRL
jgi:ABC-type transporter MlaC component